MAVHSESCCSRARLVTQPTGLCKTVTRPIRSNPRRGPIRGTCSGDGGYSVVETAIVWPVFFALILLVVQFSLLWHARHVAEAAARDGLEAARGLDGSSARGQAAATGYLDDVAPRLLTGPTVDVTRTATTVRVQVRAHVLRVIPGWDLTVAETVSGPVEQFTSPSRVLGMTNGGSRGEPRG